MKDLRERHLVCRLDRYQLEDKYLRLLDEMQEMKKLSNDQEDKIKKLTTKFMRITDNPKSCITALDVVNDKDKIAALEAENAKLKDKVGVLRSQLLSHKFGKRSPSIGRGGQAELTSGVTTCRSETSRFKGLPCNCVSCTGNEDKHEYMSTIQELAVDKKKLESRIAELEGILATYTADSRRDKVAENVEYIRVWRQLKQCNEKLLEAQKTNESLNSQILNLRETLEESDRNNRNMTAFMCSEKKRIAEMEESLKIKANDSKSLHAKEERIRDLLEEITALRQQNKDIILLNSKLETENTELKRKMSEQSLSHQSLKSAYSNDQMNIAALQNANEQLLGKLHELQRNIDILTMQLMTFQHEKASSEVHQVYKKYSTTPTWSDHRDHLKFTSKSANDDNIQECEYSKVSGIERSSQTHIMNMREESSQTDNHVECLQTPNLSTKIAEYVPTNSPSSGSRVDIFHGSNPLSRERILMLLEQAQINSPLSSQRFRQIDDSADIEPSPIFEYNSRQRQVTYVDKMLLDEHRCF